MFSYLVRFFCLFFVGFFCAVNLSTDGFVLYIWDDWGIYSGSYLKLFVFNIFVVFIFHGKAVGFFLTT